MRPLFFLFSFFLTIFSYAQSDSKNLLDSLETVLKTLTKDTQRVDVLCQLTKEYDGVDSLKTFTYGFQALELSDQLDYGQGQAHANFMLGRAYMYIDPQQAFDYLKKGKGIADGLLAEKPTQEIKRIWASGIYNLAITYGYLGDHQKELEITDKVIPVVTELGDSSQLANIHTNIGVKYLNFADYPKAYESLKIGRAIYKKLGDPKEVTFNQIQLAMALEHLDSLQQMKDVLDAAEMNLGKYPNAFDEFHFLLQDSRYHLSQNEYEATLSNLNSALKLIGNDTKSIQYGMIQQRIAKVFEKKKDYKKANHHISQYLDNAIDRKNNLSIFQGYYKRSQYEASDKNYKNAYEDLLQALDVYDSIETSNIKSELKELEIKYELAEQETTMLKLRNEKNEADLALEKQRSKGYLYAVIIVLLALIFLVGYVFYRNQLRKVRRKERIREAELQLLKQEQQNKIFSAMIEGQEKERKRLAIDLHDGLGGRLSGISLNLSKLDKDEPEQYPKQKLRKVMKDLDDSLQELRTIARNLMPETLVKFGLEAALKDYCNNMTDQDTKITLQFYGAEEGIHLSQQVTIYRVIQELINNAVKHANASEVLIQYMRSGNQVDITVEDNGVGLSDTVIKEGSSGMGLSNLRTRVAYLNGELDFQSEKNEGTTVNIHIQVDAA